MYAISLTYDYTIQTLYSLQIFLLKSKRYYLQLSTFVCVDIGQNQLGDKYKKEENR
jgi:hypothetical protein